MECRSLLRAFLALGFVAVSGAAPGQTPVSPFQSCGLPTYPVVEELQADATAPDEEDTDDSDSTDSPAAPDLSLDVGNGFCGQLSGSVNGSLARQIPRLDDPRLQALAGEPSTNFQAGANASLEIATLWAGTYAGLKFGVMTAFSPTFSTEITEVSGRVGRVFGGYTSSVFSYWDGGDFIASAFTLGRTTALVGADLFKHADWTLSVAFENPAISAYVVPGVVQTTQFPLPDTIVRLAFERDELEGHLAFAARRIAPATGNDHWGYAATIGGAWTTDIRGIPNTVSGQFTYAREMPSFLGTRFDTRTFRTFIQPDDVSEGWSGVLSIRQEWTEQWATSAFVSRVALNFPTIAGRSGSALVTRMAINATYQPTLDWSVSGEVGYARGEIDLPDRLIQPLATSGEGWSFTVSATRSF